MSTKLIKVFFIATIVTVSSINSGHCCFEAHHINDEQCRAHQNRCIDVCTAINDVLHPENKWYDECVKKCDHPLSRDQICHEMCG
ncbi:MAG: hypothetical protein K2P93_03075 [Alphaproteobacteria bacterium]|nr:hypothetical protein [Alphaproteobacteria bacterium]